MTVNFAPDAYFLTVANLVALVMGGLADCISATIWCIPDNCQVAAQRSRQRRVNYSHSLHFGRRATIWARFANISTPRALIIVRVKATGLA